MWLILVNRVLAYVTEAEKYVHISAFILTKFGLLILVPLHSY